MLGFSLYFFLRYTIWIVMWDEMINVGTHDPTNPLECADKILNVPTHRRRNRGLGAPIPSQKCKGPGIPSPCIYGWNPLLWRFAGTFGISLLQNKPTKLRTYCTNKILNRISCFAPSLLLHKCYFLAKNGQNVTSRVNKIDIFGINTHFYMRYIIAKLTFDILNGNHIFDQKC